MYGTQVINVLIGVVQFAIALTILVEARRVGRGIPIAIFAMCIFLVLNALVAINRSEVLWQRTENLSRATFIDAVSLVAVIFVLIYARRLARTVLATLDLAEYKKAEYTRARTDYSQLVRHRIMNPLTVIEGAAVTLQAETQMDESTRAQLFNVILQSTQLLKDTTLEPEQRDDLERGLNAIPHIGKRD